MDEKRSASGNGQDEKHVATNGNGGGGISNFLRSENRGWGLLVVALLLVLLFFILAFVFGWPPFAVRYPSEEYFVQNQIIVTGLDDELTRALLPETRLGNTTAITEEVTLTLKRSLDFSQLELGARKADAAALEDIQCPGLPENIGQLRIEVYEIAGDKPDVKAAIEAIKQRSGENVSVEPDWVTGYPHDPGGSPFFETDEVPENKEIKTQIVTSADFEKQWAFGAIGSDGQFGPLGPGEQVPSVDGVRVAVFDTSPFALETLDTPEVFTYELGAKLPPLKLEVLHPSPLSTPAPRTRGKQPPAYLRQHGLSVAGLIHSIAPISDNIELIRVLEDDNRGTMATLNKALFDFIENADKEKPTVINLSLGIRIPPEQAGFGLPTQIQSLRYLIAAARCKGIVVVAASGNDSAKLSQPELANLPADWTSVISVAANNKEKGRSCFSNQGDIAAPGADGREVGPGGDSTCKLRTPECKDASCPYGVIGPVLGTDDKLDYIYWSGTSFAAPMVSGLAARVLEKGEGKLSPADVQAILECGSTYAGDRYMGAGVISMTKTLSDCLVLPP